MSWVTREGVDGVTAGRMDAAAGGGASSSDDDPTRLYLVVGRLTRSLRRIGLGSAELGHGAVSALNTLVRHGPMRLGDLAAREGVAPPTLSRVVSSLVEGGYVRREPDPHDGRAFLVTATAEGEWIISGMWSNRLRELRRRIDRLSPEQWQAVVAALPALESLVDQDGNC